MKSCKKWQKSHCSWLRFEPKHKTYRLTDFFFPQHFRGQCLFCALWPLGASNRIVALSSRATLRANVHVVLQSSEKFPHSQRLCSSKTSGELPRSDEIHTLILKDARLMPHSCSSHQLKIEYSQQLNSCRSLETFLARQWFFRLSDFLTHRREFLCWGSDCKNKPLAPSYLSIQLFKYHYDSPSSLVRLRKDTTSCNFVYIILFTMVHKEDACEDTEE